ncbi:MAG: hypothetical protein U1F52_11765 [Burkholderiales bacterium]
MSTGNPYSVQTFRRNLPYFIFGKAGNGLLNFLCFLLVARVLPTTEYGYYVTAVASLELGLYVSSFGVEWPSALLVPSYRRHGNRKALEGFIGKLAMRQAIGHSIAAAILLLGADYIAGVMGIVGFAPTLQVFGAIVLLEGCSRMVRDQFLNALLAQRAAQGTQFLRNTAVFAFLIYAQAHGSSWAATDIALLEAVGSGVSLLGGAIALRRHITSQMPMSNSDNDAKPLPAWGEATNMARNGYLSSLCTVAYGSQVLTLLVASFLGPRSAAEFGFARTFVEQLGKYMPALLFMGMARPMFADRYREHRDARRLVDDLTLFLKVNLLIATPIVLFLGAYGHQILPYIASDSLQSVASVLSVVSLWLIANGLRRVIDTEAAVIGRSGLSMKCNLLLCLTPVVAGLQFENGLDVYGVGLILIVSEYVYGALMLYALHADMRSAWSSWMPIIRLVLTVPLIAVALREVPLALGPRGLLVGLAISGLIGVVLPFALRTFRNGEWRSVIDLVSPIRRRNLNT